MIKDFLSGKISSQANYVEYGYGQVEPNHLSAQRTGQIYAQLPAASTINVLEQGQFVKYDYATGVVNFTGEGEWMLCYNEIKLYREKQLDCEFAMVKDNYNARVYSPVAADPAFSSQSRYYNGVDDQGNNYITIGQNTYYYDDVTAGPDMYEPHYNEDPFHIASKHHEKMMPDGTKMVPRVFKTNIGDIFTTNTVNVITAGDAPTTQEIAALTVGKYLAPSSTNGILTMQASKPASGMIWQVVKVYTMPDHQRGVKIMRIA